MGVGCSNDNKNGDGKPTSTISTLTVNAIADITNTTAIATNNTIYRLGHTDSWACKNCKIKDDKHFIQIHDCSGKK